MGARKPKQFTPDHHTEREWLRKFFASGCCYYCGELLTLRTVTKDHKTPTCREGSDEIWNIVPACKPCNQMKGWRTEAEFLLARPGLYARGAQLRRGIENLNTTQRPAQERITALEEKIEPGLLQALKREAESLSPSWAWRNPA